MELSEQTARESAKRRAIVEAAQGSLRLEGFTLSETTKTLQQRYVDGELTVQELVAESIAIAGLS